MTPERWQRVEELYQAAVDRDVEQRAEFLHEACGGDSELRSEVESLLAQQGATHSFLETPAREAAARAISQSQHVSLVGRQLGGYRVVAQIGAGAWARCFGRWIPSCGARWR